MNTKTKAQRINKRQDAIWDKAKRAQAEKTAAAAPEVPRKPSEYPDALYNKWTPKDTMTTKPAHTPGPWTLRPLYRDRLIIAFSVESETRSPIAGITVTDQSQEDIANAHLIAAAPDLLEALKEIRNFGLGMGIDDEHRVNGIREFARAVIAKAERNS